MSILVAEPAALRVWFDEDDLWVALNDGRQLSVPLAYFPRLLHASAEQRAKYEMSGRGTGLHWPEIDEDISVAGLLLGEGDTTRLSCEHHATCPQCREGSTS